MSSSSGKPNQAMQAQLKRFEGILKRPENRECFDCTSKQPRWASTNLGIFFCLRCAGIHRSLGVHISKVKSTTMDLWEESMIDVCDRIGNGNGKDLYEARAPPDFRKPESNADTGLVERLLRQKYEVKAYYPKDFDALRQKFLDTVPRDAAPTPCNITSNGTQNISLFLAGPTGCASPTPCTASTPTFSVASPISTPPIQWSDTRASPATAAGGGLGAAVAPEWSEFQTIASAAPRPAGGTRNGGHQIVPASSVAVPMLPNTDDLWGDFATTPTAPTAAKPASVPTSAGFPDSAFSGQSGSASAPCQPFATLQPAASSTSQQQRSPIDLFDCTSSASKPSPSTTPAAAAATAASIIALFDAPQTSSSARKPVTTPTLSSVSSTATPQQRLW